MRRQHRPLGHRYPIAIAAVIAVTGAALLRPVAAQDDGRLTIPLNENENSGVSGTATLAADGENTRVSMELSGDPVTGDHPTHIHTGTCRDFDPDPTYPLTTVVLDEVSDEGESETTVEDVALDDLLEADYVILVHESAEELYPEWVCGDIKLSAAVTRPPGAGVGTARGADPFSVSAALVVLALLMASAGVRLAWRGRHG